jgi:phage repressor protein C with HTH and peptisase S24 domain
MIDRDALISAREAKGLSQPGLAKLAGCSQQLIGALETGATKSTKFLPKIAHALEVDPGILDTDWAGISLPPEPPPEIIAESALLMPGRDFPIYASVEGGPGEIIRSTDPVDWHPRPAQVAHVKNAYGLFVVGESMAPEFDPGDIALVNPILPAMAGKPCIFYAERDGEARATIKRYQRATAEKWHVYQHNPPRGGTHEFTLSRKEWSICHRVLGKYYPQ